MPSGRYVTRVAIVALSFCVMAAPQTRDKQDTGNTQDSQDHRAPDEHPANPREKVAFYCRAGQRYVESYSQNFEVGDTWNGVVAYPHLCGGCFFENAPGSYPGTDPDYQHKIKVVAQWGDGSVDELYFTSDHLTQGPITLGSNGMTGSHQYNKPIVPPQPMVFESNQFCVDDQGQWWERENNYCAYSVPYGCTSYPATVGVYPADPPSNATIARVVKHGQIAPGALSVVLQDDAPPSGTKLTLKSSNPLILFPQSGQPSTQTSIVKVMPTQHAGNFDIDATKASAGTKFTISVTNTNTPGQPVTTLQYTVQ